MGRFDSIGNGAKLGHGAIVWLDLDEFWVHNARKLWPVRQAGLSQGNIYIFRQKTIGCLF